MKSVQWLKSKPRLLYVALFLVVVFLFATSWDSSSVPQPPKGQTQGATSKSSISYEYVKSNSKLRSQAYPVNSPPDCFGIDCHDRNNKHAYEVCPKSSEATNLNIAGVKSMERYVSGYVTFDSVQHLHNAYELFKKAVKVDETCLRARVNFALTIMQMNIQTGESSEYPFNDAIEQMSIVLKEEEYCRHYALRGFFRHLNRQYEQATQDWTKAVKINPRIGEGRYMGIINVNDTNMERHEHPENSLFWEMRTEPEFRAMSHALVFTEFSTVSLSGYALLQHDVADFFTQNKYFILQRIIPPFILQQVKNFYISAIETKLIPFKDPQALRYYAGNDRIARYLHYGLTDLFRAVVQHNLIPTYTYFGGYIGGSELSPHTDRHACEFTASLCLYNNPEDQPWPLGLGKKSLFERKDEEPGGSHPLPPDNEQVEAALHEGDTLLFMGRHLVHWRFGTLQEGHSTYNVFLHYVQNDFPKNLDK